MTGSMRTFVTDKQTDEQTDEAGYIGPEGGSKNPEKISTAITLGCILWVDDFVYVLRNERASENGLKLSFYLYRISP